MRDAGMDLPPLPMRLACTSVGATIDAMVNAITVTVVEKEVRTVCFLEVDVDWALQPNDRRAANRLMGSCG